MIDNFKITMDDQENISNAVEIIKDARALVITAGAGMGVDSGLPDFRGNKGFWKAYPMYKKLGINFMEAANPKHFSQDPEFGWGFYGHRLTLYRKTNPHPGYLLLLDWVKNLKVDYFVVTSNVDGQFQKAGFDDDKIYEVHGSIHHLQCTQPCNDQIWTNFDDVDVDLSEMRAREVPSCPFCSTVARPNILMFSDHTWNSHRSDSQEKKFFNFLERYRKSFIAVIEIGAGTTVPTIRMMSERISGQYRAKVIRINPREAKITEPNISICSGALDGLEEINSLLNAS